MLIKPGNVIKLGQHRLACGDCRDESLVKNLIGDNKISLVVTDPPYGISYIENKSSFAKIRTDKIIENDNFKSEEEYKRFSNQWLSCLKTYLDSKNSLYIFQGDKMLFALKAALDEQNIKLAQLLIWVKSQSVIGRKDYMGCHELILYCWSGTHRFYKSKDSTLLYCPKPSKNLLHPTMKPVSLIRRLILNSSNIGDIVFDPFAGSGTTLLACEQTARRCLTIESDSDYCMTIITRYKK